MLNPDLKKIFKETYIHLSEANVRMTKDTVANALNQHALANTRAGRHAIKLWANQTDVYPPNVPVKSVLKAFAQISN